MVQKAPLTASLFTAKNSTARQAPSAIVHTRQHTQGSPQFNVNNHPIRTGPIVGVHNGMVMNDGEIFRSLADAGVERQGLVDSEAIFAAIAYGTTLVESQTQPDVFRPVLGADLKSSIEEVETAAAIAWYDEDTGTDVLHLARFESNPLAMAQNRAGSFFFASEMSILQDLFEMYGFEEVWSDYAEEGTLWAVRDGRIIEASSFNPAPYWTSRYSNYDYGWKSDPTNNYTKTPTTKVRTITPAKTGQVRDFSDLRNLTLDAGLLSGETATVLSEDERKYVYWGRMAEVDDLLWECERALREQGEDVKEYVQEILLESKAWCDQGDGVASTLGGEEWYGVIVSMPKDTIEGSYVLKLWVDNPAFPGKYEGVLVTRRHDEFVCFSEKEIERWVDGILDVSAPSNLTASYSSF